MLRLPLLCFIVGFVSFGSLLNATAWSQDYRVETLEEKAPTDELDSAIAEQLADTGYRIVRGESRTVCDIWPCKSWDVPSGFQPSIERLYPFKPGQLIGVIEFPRRGSDFRDQQISSGVYTLRYALQPIDGNHVGTSPTRDFLLALPAAEDTSTDRVTGDRLNDLSAEAAGSTHPALFSLQLPSGSTDSAELKYDESREWWILQFAGAAADGKPQPVHVVVVGHASE